MDIEKGCLDPVPHWLLAESIKWYGLGLICLSIDLATISPMIFSGGTVTTRGKKGKLEFLSGLDAPKPN